MLKRKIVEIEVDDPFDADELPFGEAVRILSEALASIPKEFRASARFAFDYYGGHARITYSRPETDEELAARAAEENEWYSILAANKRNR